MVRCASLARSGLNTVLEDASLPNLLLNDCFNPAGLLHHLGKAMVCKLACFFPVMDLFLAGWQGHGHIHVLVYIPQAGYNIPAVSCLDGGLRWSPFPTMHLVGLLLSFPGSFLSSCMPAKVNLHPYPLYAQPCFLHVKSSSFWQ